MNWFCPHLQQKTRETCTANYKFGPPGRLLFVLAEMHLSANKIAKLRQTFSFFDEKFPTHYEL
jgi:hypothetical protein